MSNDKALPVPDGYVEVFCRSYFNKKLGRRIYAHEYGKEAFRFLIPVEKYTPKG